MYVYCVDKINNAWYEVFDFCFDSNPDLQDHSLCHTSAYSFTCSYVREDNGPDKGHYWIRLRLNSSQIW